MNASTNKWILLIVLLFLSNTVYSRNEVTPPESQIDSQALAQDRATIIFRILNQAGIKHEQTRVNAYQNMEQGDNAGARNVCNTFIAEIDGVRDSLKELTTLSREDVRYLDRSLKAMQKDIERMLSDMPFFN